MKHYLLAAAALGFSAATALAVASPASAEDYYRSMRQEYNNTTRMCGHGQDSNAPTGAEFHYNRPFCTTDTSEERSLSRDMGNGGNNGGGNNGGAGNVAGNDEGRGTDRQTRDNTCNSINC